MLRLAFVAALVYAGVGTAESHPPTVLAQSKSKNFVARPAWIAIPGEGGWIVGGTAGTGDGIHFGRIRWIRWTRHGAVGQGVTWARCLDVGGCRTAYKLQRGAVRFRVFAPVHGHFTRISGGLGAWRLQRGDVYTWANA
jgi:hypothetical protein